MDKNQASTSTATRRRVLTWGAAGAMVYAAGHAVRAETAPVLPREGILGHQIFGRGPETVLVLHEWLGDHVNWQPTWSYLDDERSMFVFADLRGYGWSKGLAGTFGLDEAVADALRLADTIGAKRFHIVGHSMSGMIAQRIAQKAKERVKSATLICPVPASGFKANEAALKGLNAVIEDDAAAIGAFVARGGGRYGETWLARKLAIARNAATKEAMRGYLRMFTQNDFSAEVKGLDTPILVLAGRHDLPLYREDALRGSLGSLYPRLDIAVSEEAGHYPMLETPILVASQIERQVKKFAG